eukprot:COSAG01_NODE_1925_length_8884_cov_6.366648_11_plen_79_part_00
MLAIAISVGLYSERAGLGKPPVNFQCRFLRSRLIELRLRHFGLASSRSRFRSASATRFTPDSAQMIKLFIHKEGHTKV